MSVYDETPDKFLEHLGSAVWSVHRRSCYCAGFEVSEWRCNQLANHLIEWLPDYALLEDDLLVTHGNMYVRMQAAAMRVYTSENYKKRGEAGEIALHAVCRQFFSTIPISPRVFYKSAANDVVKSFDLVHARILASEPVEIWLGESKLYKDASDAIGAAISSVELHLEHNFLRQQKILLGPQIPSNTARRPEIVELFKPQTSLDKFLGAAVFVVGILANSPTTANATCIDPIYQSAIVGELSVLADRLDKAGITGKVRVVLVYIPLADKDKLLVDFDRKLKGLQA